MHDWPRSTLHAKTLEIDLAVLSPCPPSPPAILGPMSKDPFIREKFTRERTTARKLAEEYFQRFPKDRYQTEVESWRHLQSENIEFTMKRLRVAIEGAG
jgi:hypothetical protein